MRSATPRIIKAAHNHGRKLLEPIVSNLLTISVNGTVIMSILPAYSRRPSSVAAGPFFHVRARSCTAARKVNGRQLHAALLPSSRRHRAVEATADENNRLAARAHRNAARARAVSPWICAAFAADFRAP